MSKEVHIVSPYGEKVVDVGDGCGKIHVWMIGETDRPATEEDISKFSDDLSLAIKEGDSHIVTHHAVRYVEVRACCCKDCCCKSSCDKPSECKKDKCDRDDCQKSD